MTKKHFIALAYILREAKPKGNGFGVDNAVKGLFDRIVIEMTAYFAISFPNFDAKKWDDYIYKNIDKP